jgi:hypothetical protein
MHTQHGETLIGSPRLPRQKGYLSKPEKIRRPWAAPQRSTHLGGYEVRDALLLRGRET